VIPSAPRKPTHASRSFLSLCYPCRAVIRAFNGCFVFTMRAQRYIYAIHTRVGVCVHVCQFRSFARADQELCDDDSIHGLRGPSRFGSRIIRAERLMCSYGATEKPALQRVSAFLSRVSVYSFTALRLTERRLVSQISQSRSEFTRSSSRNDER